MEKNPGQQNLARLGGLEIDPSGKMYFEQLNHAATERNLRIFSTEGMVDESGEINKEIAEAESYGLSAALIDIEWDHVKHLDADFVKGPDIKLDESFWVNFQKFYFEIFAEGQDYLKERADVLLQGEVREDSDYSREEKILLRYFFIQFKLERNLGLPSFKDFILLYTKFAEVAYRKYVESYGGKIERKHFEYMLNHPSFNAILVSIMNNNRRVGASIMTTMHEGSGEKQLDLNDPSIMLRSELFKLDVRPEGPILEIDQDFINQAREAALENTEQLEPKPRILRCPVTYISKFKEMTTWFKDKLLYHLYPEQREGDL